MNTPKEALVGFFDFFTDRTPAEPAEILMHEDFS